MQSPSSALKIKTVHLHITTPKNSISIFTTVRTSDLTSNITIIVEG
jgi:hypothetical protein